MWRLVRTIKEIEIYPPATERTYWSVYWTVVSLIWFLFSVVMFFGATEFFPGSTETALKGTSAITTLPGWSRATMAFLMGFSMFGGLFASLVHVVCVPCVYGCIEKTRTRLSRFDPIPDNKNDVSVENQDDLDLWK